jgi:hypothetical protein
MSSVPLSPAETACLCPMQVLPAMKVFVTCRSQDGPIKMRFAMPCGDGEQTLKWLALAAAQRYTYLKNPHGRYRWVP